jgi:L-ascorbate metabolism protein UlaG (beta-lactamase superfamily)
MVITWYGLSCIKIETQDTVLVFNPFEKNESWGADRSPRFKADVICVSGPDPLYNAVSGIEGNPFIISSPGEYELKGVVIRGLSQSSDKAGSQTVFAVEAEGLIVVHLGAWAGVKIPETIRALASGADVLCLPIGGDKVLDANQAATLAAQLEASLVVPVMYRPSLAQKDSGPVAKLIKAMNVPVERQEKLSLKKKDITSDRTSLVVLSSLLAK